MRDKKAFTMVELIIVIITLAILATYSIPRIKRDTRSEAINHILTMIRYTQNLALHDDMHLKNNSNWQKRFWSFEIKKCANSTGLYYAIGTDNDMQGAIDKEESAIDPSNSKYTFWYGLKACPKNTTDALSDEVSPNIFITQKYGIKEVNFKNCAIYKDKKTTSSNKRIGFDNFGRYYKSYSSNSTPNNSGIGVGNCKIEFKFIDNSINPFTILVSKESGFAYLEENPNL